MKSTVNNLSASMTIPFPKLMQGKCSGTVFLMLNEETGIVVYTSCSQWKLGEQTTKKDLVLSSLSDFHGSVTIEA